MRQVKCPYCGTMNDKENTVLYKKRYYCKDKDCLTKKKEESNLNSDGWDELYNYIIELYGEPPTGQMYNQLKQYRNPPYNYKNKGMLLTLKYFYETLGNSVIKEKGLGIISYKYKEAERAFIKKRKINKINAVIEYNNNRIKVRVKPTKNQNKNKVIDFDTLEVEDE